jgi:hypothetical protein
MKTITMLLAIFLIAVSGVSAQNAPLMDSVITWTIPGPDPQTQRITKIVPVGNFPNYDFGIVKYVIEGNTDSLESGYYIAYPGDTLSIPLDSLVPGTTYDYRAYFVFSGLSSKLDTFATSNCSFTAGITGNAQGMCFDTLYATVSDTSGDQYEYQWKFNGMFIPYANSATYVAGYSGNYSVLISNGVCTDESPILSVTITQPVVTITGPNSVCEGSAITLRASGANTYLWQPGGLTGDSITVTPTQSTMYTVYGTVSFGCQGMATKVVTVYPVPTVSIAPSADSICVNSVENIYFILSPSGGTLSGTGISGWVFDPRVAGVGNHTITYTYTGTGGCVDSASTIVHVLSAPQVDSVRKIGIEANLIVYGSFNYQIELTIGDITYQPVAQNNSQAIFYGVAVSNGNLLIIRSTDGGCFTLWMYSTLGIEEILPGNTAEDKRIYDILGREVKNPLPNTLYVRGGKKFVFLK